MVIIRALVVLFAVAQCLWACTPTVSESQPESDRKALEADEVSFATVERVISPTPEMLAAALSGERLKMQAAMEAVSSLHSCFEVNQCPPEFDTCTDWSSPSVCHWECHQYCGLVDRNPTAPDTSGSAVMTLYRVCFNAEQQACTEKGYYIEDFCGC